MQTIGAEQFIDVIKLAGVVFGLVHLGVGIVLLRQILVMNRKVKTASGGCVQLFSLLHILILAGILLLVIFV